MTKAIFGLHLTRARSLTIEGSALPGSSPTLTILSRGGGSREIPGTGGVWTNQALGPGDHVVQVVGQLERRLTIELDGSAIFVTTVLQAGNDVMVAFQANSALVDDPKDPWPPPPPPDVTTLDRDTRAWFEERLLSLAISRGA